MIKYKPGDRDRLKQIQKLLERADCLYNDLYNETKEICDEYHNDFTLPNCLYYHRELDKVYCNIVTIHTAQNGKYVDDTGDVYVTDGDDLRKELERIWNYRNFGTI